MFFFFQAEDGIRDTSVTGVQTCALPIWPVILTDYPAGIKAFYMRLNDDHKTVAALDVLVPKVGEIIGGSQREERYDVLVRSEERRVGKEWRSWWGGETEKKKVMIT